MMPCSITDGPQPDEEPPAEVDEDAAYELWRSQQPETMTDH